LKCGGVGATSVIMTWDGMFSAEVLVMRQETASGKRKREISIVGGCRRTGGNSVFAQKKKNNKNDERKKREGETG